MNKEFNIRRATESDIEWMYQTSVVLFKEIDEQSTKSFLKTCVNNTNEVLILRGDHAAIGVYLYAWPYNNQIIMAEDLFIGSDSESVWELLAIFEKIVAWCKEKGAQELKFDLSLFSKTGKSLDPFAKRLGASSEKPTYRIKLR